MKSGKEFQDPKTLESLEYFPDYTGLGNEVGSDNIENPNPEI